MLGTFGILMHRKWALEYDAYELKYVPVFHRAITFAWEDVESVRLLKRGEGWELRLAGGPKVTVSREMMGAREFLLTLTEKTGVRVAGDG
jgi:hypothetical protein